MRKNRIIFVFLSAVLLLGGCAQGKKSEALAISETLDFSVSEAASLNESVNAFGWKLFGQLSKEENTLFSPLSLHLVLGMLANGCEGTVQDELLAALGIDALDNYNSAVLNLIDISEAEDSALHLGFSVWLDDEIQLAENAQKEFLDPLAFYYHSRAYKTDLGSQSGIDEVNRWVKENTGGMIEKLLSDPDETMRLILANTVYFKGNWQMPFKAETTRNEIFHGLDGDQNVKMMHQYGISLKWLDNGSLRAVSLPYEENEMKMVVILPSESEDASLAELLSSLSAEEIEAFLTQLEEAERVKVNLGLPKFSLNAEIESLPKKLEALGIHAVFDDQKTDTLAKIGENLYVSEVLHKAAIKVDEKGTEAAAVSAVVANETAAVIEEPPIDFVVDQPFFLAMIDQDGLIYFMGMVSSLSD